MKPYVKLIAAMFAVGGIVACGAAGDSDVDSEVDDLTSEDAALNPEPQAVPAADDDAMTSNESSQDAIGSEGENAFTKKCSATCTVVDLAPGDGIYCPATIGGYGTNGWWSCTKACTKARADAASKLPSGCVINNCNQVCY